MNEPGADGDLAISLRVADPDLLAHLTALIAHAPGLRIADRNETADLVLSAADGADGRFAHPLTPREQDVIALLAEGLSNKQIGSRLGISPDTAKFHVGRVIDKLDATGRTDAVAHAARRGIIHL